MTTIRERRFKIMLYSSNEKFDDKEDKYLCELQSCQLTFQLTAIPKAVIRPNFGTVINKEKASVSFDRILELASDHSPVKVKLVVTHSFSSESDEADSEEWPFEITGKKDRFGQYNTKPITIFEGYLAPPSAEVVATRATMSLTIMHWLSSLAGMSMLTTACHTSTPMALSLQLYGGLWALPQDKGIWCRISPSIQLYNTPDGLWQNGIKQIFTAVLNAPNRKTAEGVPFKNGVYNEFSKTMRDRIALAINRIKGTALCLRRFKGTDVNNDLSLLIGPFLNSEVYSTYVKQSGWDRLLYFGSCFLFSVSPRVKDAKLIPLPGIIDPNNAIELHNEDIIQISSAPLSTVQLRQLICVPSATENVSASDRGKQQYIPIAKYPTDTEALFRDGFIKAISYPSWITRNLPRFVPKAEAVPTAFVNVDDYKKALKNSAKRSEVVDKARKKIVESLGRAYTGASFIAQALNTTWANIVTQARMDICPGAHVKAFIQPTDQNINLELYGIVTGVTVNLVAGTSPSTTQLVLSMLRDKESIYDAVLNPYIDEKDPDSPNKLGFYTDLWSGKGVNLYD